MLPVAIAMLGTARPPTIAFLGWFGPRGLASIVFAVLVIEPDGRLPGSVLLTTIFVTIGLSVLAHGVTAAPLAAATPPGTPPIRRSAPVESGERCHEVRWRFSP